MILSRAPLRITFGGGGTDLPFYYEKSNCGGFWISAAINRHIYCILHDRSIEQSVKLKYSEIEVVSDISKIKHNIFREVLQEYNLTRALEITTVADVGAGTGLGSSGTFTVALLNAVHNHKNLNVSKVDLADEACKFESMHSIAGKQDPYIATYGGIRAFWVTKRGKVTLESLKFSPPEIRALQDNILLFFTGYARESNTILVKEKMGVEDGDKRRYLDKIYDLGEKAYGFLGHGDFKNFGKTFSEHWEAKKAIDESMTSGLMDEIYSTAMDLGAIGGKSIGAGGAGGFFMFYSDNDGVKEDLRDSMTHLGLKEMSWQFDWDGAKVYDSFA